MPLESANYIGQLNPQDPGPADRKSQGDDHIRLLKTVLQNSFPGVEGPVYMLGTDTGTANTLTANPTPAITQYVSGMQVAIQVANASTGPVTLNISGLGPVPLRHPSGQTVGAGDLPAGAIAFLIYDGTAFVAVGGSPFVSKRGDQTIAGDITVDGDLVVTGAVSFLGLVGSGFFDFSAGTTLVRTMPSGSPNSNDAASVAFVNQAIMNTYDGNIPPYPGDDSGNLFKDSLGDIKWKAKYPGTIADITTNTTAQARWTYLIRASLTLTLPNNLEEGDWVAFVNLSGTTTAQLDMNGTNLRGRTGIIPIDDLNASAILSWDEAGGYI